MSKVKTRSRAPAFILMLAMVLILLPAMAFAAAPTGVTVYVEGAGTPVSPPTLADGATAEDAYLQVTSASTYPDTILYKVNGELGAADASSYIVQSGDYLAFYDVSDYATDTLATLCDYNLIMDGGRLIKTSSTGYEYYGWTTNFNMNHPVGLSATCTTTTGSSGITVTGVGMNTDFIPVTTVTDFSNYTTVLNNGLDKLIEMASFLGLTGEDEYTAAVSARAGSDNSVKASAKIALGDVVHDASTPSGALTDIYFSDDVAIDGYFDAKQPSYTLISTTADGYVPSRFTIYATAGGSVSYDSSAGGMTISDGVVSFSAGGTYTLTVSVSGGKSYTFSITYVAPAAAGSTPTYVNGYLPLGQYASGQGWGSIYSAYTNPAGNDLRDGDDPTTVYPATKITSGYAGTGISLGSPGGYVQFEFASPVENNASNKFGIDFIIYGNPFNGNPEAGSVKVSCDGTTWYELAGSRYYNSETIRNTNISYKMVPASTYTTDKKADIYYAIGTVPTGTGTTGWTLYKSNVVWWPEAAEGYDIVSGVDGQLFGTQEINNVTYKATSEVVNGAYCWIITYSGVNLVLDSDTTNDYLFGYADVRSNGSSYGAAINPYASTPTSGSGGDGFDIAWAVNSNGTPENLTSIKYVRVYTSAALSPSDPTVLPTPGIFGETSTEVCGAFTATESGTGGATSDLEIWGDTQVPIFNEDSTAVDAGSYYIYSAEDYVYVNGAQVDASGEDGYEVTLTSGDMVQVITQSGTESPFITVIYCN